MNDDHETSHVSRAALDQRLHNAQTTKLTAFFQFCANNFDFACEHQITYQQIPKYAVYCEKSKSWQLRKKQGHFVTGRLMGARSKDPELQALRRILHDFVAPRSFKHLLTLSNGTIAQSFQEVAIEKMYVRNPQHVFDILKQVVRPATSASLARENFVRIIYHSKDCLRHADVATAFNDYLIDMRSDKLAMIQHYQPSSSQSTAISTRVLGSKGDHPELESTRCLTESRTHKLANEATLNDVRNLFLEIGAVPNEEGMIMGLPPAKPELLHDFNVQSTNSTTASSAASSDSDVTDSFHHWFPKYSIPESEHVQKDISFAEEQMMKNSEQYSVYQELLHYTLGTQTDSGHLGYLLLAPAGSGKSFVLNTIIKKVILSGKNVVVCAASGIAATQLTHARTFHSLCPLTHCFLLLCLIASIFTGTFGAPNDTVLPMNFGSHPRHKAMLAADIVIIDEISLLHKNYFTALFNELSCRGTKIILSGTGDTSLLVRYDFLILFFHRRFSTVLASHKRSSYKWCCSS